MYAPSFMHMYAMGFPCQTISYISKGKNGTNCKKIIFHKPYPSAVAKSNIHDLSYSLSFVKSIVQIVWTQFGENQTSQF